jgi:16S rRNA (guanine527-N7)-methyltransferase
MARRAGSPDLDQRLHSLAERYRLTEGASGRLRCLHRVLAEDPLAPTAVRDPIKVIDDHLADSLVALELAPVRGARRLADLGSGAGVPGLPLAVALPETSVALVESSSRKCAFLDRAVGECGVANAHAVHTRLESWPEGLGAFDVVTARALGPLEVVVEYAAPLLTLDGTLVVWRGARDPEAEATAARAAAAVGLEVGEIVPVQPYPAAQNRHLHLMSKVMKTPAGFPRRPGMALKRPLGRT